MPTSEELERLRKASQQSADKARELLDSETQSVMAEVARIGELQPETADEETYNKLVALVTAATNKNESVATLKANVENLGDSAVALFKQMADIAKSLT